jgi:hypothetical protein
VVVAPFTEFRYVHSGHAPVTAGTADSSQDEKVGRFQVKKVGRFHVEKFR